MTSYSEKNDLCCGGKTKNEVIPCVLNNLLEKQYIITNELVILYHNPPCDQ